MLDRLRTGLVHLLTRLTGTWVGAPEGTHRSDPPRGG